jgi:hypothetical protein
MGHRIEPEAIDSFIEIELRDLVIFVPGATGLAQFTSGIFFEKIWR